MSLALKVSKTIQFRTVNIVWDYFWLYFICFILLAKFYLHFLAFYSVGSREFGKEIWKTWWNYSHCAHSRVPRQDIGECACGSYFPYTACSLL